jgi:hypothetical protein
LALLMNLRNLIHVIQASEMLRTTDGFYRAAG